MGTYETATQIKIWNKYNLKKCFILKGNHINFDKPVILLFFLNDNIVKYQCILSY